MVIYLCGYSICGCVAVWRVPLLRSALEYRNIYISFDGWTTKSGKRGFLGIVAHYVDNHGDFQDLLY
jgi:hypothetical protein